MERESRSPHDAWNPQRFRSESRRFDTAWDVDAPRSSRQGPARTTQLPAPVLHVDTSVTLIIYEWHNAEPGTLSWTFPDHDAAERAARTMRNAMKWAICQGRDADLEQARTLGTVLLEGSD